MKYLVEGNDGNLYGYERTDVLLADLGDHRRAGDIPKRIWRKVPGAMAVTYRPVSHDEIREEFENA